MFFFFFKQKTAYEMRISDWSSDVCSSDLLVESAQKRRRCDAGSVDRLTEFQHGRGGCARRAGPRILPVYRGDAGQNRHWLRYCLRQSGDSQVIVRSRVPRAARQIAFSGNPEAHARAPDAPGPASSPDTPDQAPQARTDAGGGKKVAD